MPGLLGRHGCRKGRAMAVGGASTEQHGKIVSAAPSGEGNGFAPDEAWGSQFGKR